MDLKIENDRIKFDRETKNIIDMFARCDLTELQMFAVNVLNFIPELMKITTNGGISFVNKMNRINSVETDEILKGQKVDDKQTLTFFEFQSILNFVEKNDRLEICVNLNGVTKSEQSGKTTVQNNSEITSSSRLIYDKKDHSGMLIERLNQPNEEKIVFCDKDGIVIDCKNILKFKSEKNTEKTPENNSGNNSNNSEINKK